MKDMDLSNTHDSESIAEPTTATVNRVDYWRFFSEQMQSAWDLGYNKNSWISFQVFLFASGLYTDVIIYHLSFKMKYFTPLFPFSPAGFYFYSLPAFGKLVWLMVYYSYCCSHSSSVGLPGVLKGCHGWILAGHGGWWLSESLPPLWVMERLLELQLSVWLICLLELEWAVVRYCFGSTATSKRATPLRISKNVAGPRQVRITSHWICKLKPYFRELPMRLFWPFLRLLLLRTHHPRSMF